MTSHHNKIKPGLPLLSVSHAPGPPGPVLLLRPHQDWACLRTFAFVLAIPQNDLSRSLEEVPPSFRFLLKHQLYGGLPFPFHLRQHPIAPTTAVLFFLLTLHYFHCLDVIYATQHCISIYLLRAVTTIIYDYVRSMRGQDFISFVHYRGPSA